MRIPRYNVPKSPSFALGDQLVHMLKIVDFLRYVINRDKLSINEYLEDMGQDPFFLVAATGLGKTVAVPVHALIRVMENIGQNPNPQPRVWVVEPRIPIAIDQMRFMNFLWQEYLQSKHEPSLPPLFGCVSSASGGVNKDAPIMFVTTGIFELMAKAGELSPLRDRVIIDEAHVTVEQNPGVELGFALARKAGVIVDFMSATVDTTTLEDDLDITNIIRADNQRFDVWKSNLFKPMNEALPEVVEATLVNPNSSSVYFPKPYDYNNADEIIAAVLEPNRSHGLLAVVNSFAGEQSDIRRLADIVRKQFPGLPVLEMASEVVRDARREQEFRRRLQAIEAAKQNYVILATSVVEMGITFPSLDFIVTMDCGYDQETIGDVIFPVVAPLGVNSLLQRIGRVGRKRPGIAYITYEVGADYAQLENDELNSGKYLNYEPIRFPMTSAPLMSLAYYACTQDWEDINVWLEELDLPSGLHEYSDRMNYLCGLLDTLNELGIVDDSDHLTPFGERMSDWIGRADLAYAVQLQEAFEDNCELPELMFWVVATALSNTPISTLCADNEFFVDYNEEHGAVEHEYDIWDDFLHEDLAAFGAVCLVAELSPQSMFGAKAQDMFDKIELERWCNLSGLGARKMLKAGKAIAELWKLFCKINAKTERFSALFGGQNAPSLAMMPWTDLSQDLPADDIHRQLSDLAGTVDVYVYLNEDSGLLLWSADGHNGLALQDATPIELRNGIFYTAKLVPSRSSEDDELTWRLAHIGEIPTPEYDEGVETTAENPEPDQPETSKEKVTTEVAPAQAETVNPTDKALAELDEILKTRGKTTTVANTRPPARTGTVPTSGRSIVRNRPNLKDLTTRQPKPEKPKTWLQRALLVIKKILDYLSEDNNG